MADKKRVSKVPPQDIYAEQCVLGGILMDNQALNKVRSILDSQDFYRESHRTILLSMIDLAQRNEPSDLITLTNELKHLKLLDSIGGASYLASLIDSVPTASNIEYYANIVKDKSRQRQEIQDKLKEFGEMLDAAEVPTEDRILK